MANISLKGKKAAVFGPGDKENYSDTFCKAVDILENRLKEFGAEIVIGSTTVKDQKPFGLTGVLRLANGNTLVPSMPFTESDVPFVIEVTSEKEIVWEYYTFTNPAGFERLENGNTLIGDFFKNRVIEVAAP